MLSSNDKKGRTVTITSQTSSQHGVINYDPSPKVPGMLITKSMVSEDNFDNDFFGLEKRISEPRLSKDSKSDTL